MTTLLYALTIEGIILKWGAFLTEFLIRRFIKNSENTSDEHIRHQYGILAGIVGIFLNSCLFLIKLIAGILSGSIAITADALNNLSDAGSSIVTLVGFRMAGRKPDIEHPFGHGRIEYISGMIVSIIIIMMGYELFTDSISKIRSPSSVTLGLLPAVILLISVLVKIWMSLFNRTIARAIHSEAMEATAADSRSDAVSTSALLIGMLIGSVFKISLDGWLGLLVSILILKTGIESARDTISPLLGQPPAPEFVSEIESIVLAHPEIIGLHDLVVHNYGPDRVMVSLHAEVPGDGELLKMHDVIDNVERELSEKLSCVATIHLDPVDTHNPLLSELHKEADTAAKSLDPACSVHDVRLISGETHSNLVFDVLVPHSLSLSDPEIRERISSAMPRLQHPPKIYAVIDIDRDYTGRS